MQRVIDRTIKLMLIGLCAIILLQSCKDADGAASMSIITGDPSTVAHFRLLDNQEMTLTGQNTTDEFSSSTYSDQIDVDQDGKKDLQIVYEDFSTTTGYKRHNAKIIIINPLMEVYSQITEIWGGPNRVVSMAMAGEEVSHESNDWSQFDESTVHLFLSEEQDGELMNEFNFFPLAGNDAYLLFKINGETTSIGWLHLNQSQELWQLSFLDIGLKPVG